MMMSGGGILVGLLVLVLFVLLLGGIVLAVVWFARQGSGALGGGQPSARSGEDALEILRRRYARGEISREEFESMREDIRS